METNGIKQVVHMIDEESVYYPPVKKQIIPP